MTNLTAQNTAQNCVRHVYFVFFSLHNFAFDTFTHKNGLRRAGLFRKFHSSVSKTVGCGFKSCLPCHINIAIMGNHGFFNSCRTTQYRTNTAQKNKAALGGDALRLSLDPQGREVLPGSRLLRDIFNGLHLIRILRAGSFVFFPQKNRPSRAYSNTSDPEPSLHLYSPLLYLLVPQWMYSSSPNFVTLVNRISSSAPPKITSTVYQVKASP